MAKSTGPELVFLPLGGVGEIGMNFALYGYGPATKREWIVVDVGVTFPDASLPGVDLVLPDIRFIESQLQNLRGIVITHAHEDHYGALLDLWPRLKVPVWMTPFAAGLLEAKRQGEHGMAKPNVIIYRAGETFTVGPFSIEAIPVSHSIPEPVSLAITTPLGTVVHTGDWKLDPAPEIGPMTDEARFRALGDAGVLALICDSTNAMREGESPSEQAVGAGLRGVIEKAPGRVAVTTFSSNVGRIRSIAEAARDCGRQVLVLGRSLKRMIDVAGDLGYMEGIPPFIAEEDYGFIPRQNLVIICTGSQGESRAALAKLARDEMKSVALSPGDIVVYSSRTIPGNERPILEIKNLLIEQGIRIIEDNEALVHVSGHPRRNELRKMYEWTRPRIGVPVHGEAAHLVAQGSLMSASGIPEVAQARNGDMLRLAPGPSRDHRQGAVGPLLQGRQADRRRPGCRHPRPQEAVLCGSCRRQRGVRREIRACRRSRSRCHRRGGNRCEGRGAGRPHAGCGHRRCCLHTPPAPKGSGHGAGSGSPCRAFCCQRRLGQEAARDGVRDAVEVGSGAAVRQ